MVRYRYRTVIDQQYLESGTISGSSACPGDRYERRDNICLEALNELEATHDFERVLDGNSPHSKYRAILQQAIIYESRMHRLLMESYRRKAMAAGAPTVCYLRDALIGTYPGSIPIVNANPDTIKSYFFLI